MESSDDRPNLSSNKSYGFNLFSGDGTYMDWVEKHRISCIVLVSYGTVSNYDATQLDKYHSGLLNFAQPFFEDVWSTMSHKLSVELKVRCVNNGSIV